MDFKGREWKSERILPGLLHRVATGDYVVTGTVDEMACEGELPTEATCKGASLSFLVFDRVKIPHNAHTSSHHHVAGWRYSHSYGSDAWRFKAAKFEFLLANDREDTLGIECVTDDPEWPPFMEERVLETLFFVLGRPLYPTVTQRRAGQAMRCTLHSRRRPPPGARHRAPLPIKYFTNSKTNKFTAEPYRKLFERYFSHCLSFGKEHHPLWAQLNAVYEASAGTFIDAQALTLGVAIESILNSEFPDLGQPSEDERKVVDEVIAHLKAWQGDKTMRDRAIGSMQGLKSARPGDKMRALAAEGAISKEASKAWSKLRNTNAHAYQSGTLQPEEFRHLLRVVQTLFYQLIFRAIGYHGPYRDIGEPGWPIKRYPLTSPLESVPS